MKAKGDLIPCQNGLHLCRRGDLIKWLGPRIFLAEADPAEIVESADKVVVRRARLVTEFTTWNERSARLFAADCAERVLLIFELKHPEDDRSRKAIEAARQFAHGEIDAAARAAAGAAARAAAGAAARDAAWAAARDAAREWQTNRLFEYLEGRVDG
jgi:hypothetical protein